MLRIVDVAPVSGFPDLAANPIFVLACVRVLGPGTTIGSAGRSRLESTSWGVPPMVGLSWESKSWSMSFREETVFSILCELTLEF